MYRSPKVILDRIICDPEGKYHHQFRFKLGDRDWGISKELPEELVALAMMEQMWIPVSEPPKERGCYLISVKHWLDGNPVTREAFWNGADWLSCYWKKGDRVELTPRVTHWMSLPQPPKGE